MLRVLHLGHVMLDLTMLQIEAAGASSRILELLARIVLVLVVLSVLHAFYLSLELLDLTLECFLVLGAGQALLVLVKHRWCAT